MTILLEAMIHIIEKHVVARPSKQGNPKLFGLPLHLESISVAGPTMQTQAV
jgi:hypothetical protein